MVLDTVRSEALMSCYWNFRKWMLFLKEALTRNSYRWRIIASRSPVWGSFYPIELAASTCLLNFPQGKKGSFGTKAAWDGGGTQGSPLLTGWMPAPLRVKGPAIRRPEPRASLLCLVSHLAVPGGLP